MTHDKYTIRSPAVATVVQTKFIWPGELAQPGTAMLSVLDPRDKYVQVYVPVADVTRMQVGQRVEIELDRAPGKRVPGEVSFVADEATFTRRRSRPGDRLAGPRARSDPGDERFQPGTEGNVYLVEAARRTGTAAAADGTDEHIRR